MIRQLRLCVLILIAIIWFIIILPYFLVQTEFGSKYASQFISQYVDDYAISVGHVSHSITKPYEFTLENLTITDKAQKITYLSAKKIVVGLKQSDLLQTESFDYLLIENGNIELSPALLVINATFLQLKNVYLHYLSPEKESEITLDNIYGGIRPWSSQFITQRQNGQFNFTIQKATYNHLNIQSVFVQGTQQAQTLRLTNLGGNIDQGFFTAKSVVFPDNTIEVNQLKIQNINFQSSINSLNVEDIFDGLPKMTIQLLSIMDSSISMPALTVEKGNLEAKNLLYDNGWQLQHSDLTFNAQSIVWNDELIEEPLIQWRNENDKIIIEQAIALWNKGNFRLSGNWQNDKLTIDSLISGNIRYQLPENWYQALYTLKLPDIFPSQIIIKQFILMPSLIIDTNPNLSFQFSAFEAFGRDIEIHSSKDDLHIDGTILLKADSGTLNTVELKKPDLVMELMPESNNVSFSTLIDLGMLEGKASLLTTKQLQSLTLNAHSVDSQILPLWHLINNPISNNKFTLELQGNLEPLSLDGMLQTQGKRYQIKNNQLVDY